ncbi:MAG: GTP-binding protein [Magnetococcales bacterium]|nr:GTP-binding protein [Magnetococcales bacterium]
MDSVPDKEVLKSGHDHLDLAERSLRDLLDNQDIPEEIRAALAEEYRKVEEILEKIRLGHIHIAVFGRVSVGKSALLNALLGKKLFSVSPLHGETRTTNSAAWQEAGMDGVFMIDTPGINEVEGEEREQMARDVADRCDLLLFVVDGDLTDTEYQALKEIQKESHRPLILVLNKVDRYTAADKRLLLETLSQRTRGLVPPEHIVACAAHPAERIYVEVNDQGEEQEIIQQPAPNLDALRMLLERIVRDEGKTLAAVNAGLVAGRLSDQVSADIIRAKRDAAERLIHAYCIGKGVGVALNPVPVADLLAVAADAAMVANLGRLYGLSINTSEAGGLIRTIITQMALLMGTVFGIQLLASALKGLSFGASTLITATAQGGVAYYGTYVVGRTAERYFAQGKSWGEGGPKQAVREILDSVERDTLMARGREEIMRRIRPKRS